jgi:PAS domain S-box-containing protein
MPKTDSGRPSQPRTDNSETTREPSSPGMTSWDVVAVHSTEASKPGEERWRPILEAVPHVVWTTLPDGSTTYLNGRGTDVLGITADHLHGWKWLELLHPEDVDRARQRWQAAVSTGTEYVNEYRLRQADGAYRWYLAQAVPLRRSDGGTSGWVGTWTDIDDRRRAEDRHIRDARLLANVRDCIIVTDGAGIVTYWNDAAARTFGWPAGEMLGQPLLNRFPEEARALVASLMARIAEGHDWSGEFEDYRKDGSRVWIDARISRISGASGQLLGVIGTSHDITARKRAEAERDRSLADLQAVSARLNEAREQERVTMARDIHDHLGQALTALKMDVAEVQRRLDVGDTVMVRERMTEMSQLLDSAMDDVRRVAAELRPVVLDDLGFVDAVRAYFIDVERRAPFRCVLHTSLTDLPIANNRATALFRILQEALTNVIRHAAATHVDVWLTLEADGVRLIIHDDGRGIPAGAAHDPRALGIIGMRDRARLFGGDVVLTGGAGQGTTVTVDMPLAEVVA